MTAKKKPTQPYSRGRVKIQVKDAVMKLIGQILATLDAKESRRAVYVSKSLPGVPSLRACVCDFANKEDEEKPALIGQGAFGKVYRVSSDSCPLRASLLPPGARSSSKAAQYAVKIEVLAQEGWWPKSMEVWSKEADLARKAGAIGAGPRVHGHHVCVHDGVMHGIVVMDHLRGVPLSDWNGNKKQKEYVRALLEAKIKLMNEGGIFHRDLHSGNVMVVTKGGKKSGEVEDVLLVDFGLATDPEGMLQEDMRVLASGEVGGLDGYVYDALVAEGTVVEGGIAF